MPNDRYAAKLLFQFRVEIDGDSGKRRICEERIINYSAGSPEKAYRAAQAKGKSAQHDYANDDGNQVYFEFVGILDILQLCDACDDEEVWYDIKERLSPMERREKLVPPKESLSIFRS